MAESEALTGVLQFDVDKNGYIGEVKFFSDPSGTPL
jgi:hypothetical protein